jgi:hypothetical protein
MHARSKEITHSISFISSPHILLAGDNGKAAESTHQTIARAGFRVQLAQGYSDVDALLAEHGHDVVLLEVSGSHTVEAAVETAIRLKRQDASQFVGYLADPILLTSGLTGDAVFPRAVNQLPQALRNFFLSGERPYTL